MKKTRIKNKKLANFIDNLKKQDKILLICTIILTVWGLFNIVTASSRESVIQYDKSLYHYFYRHLIMIIIATIGSFIIVNVSTKTYPFFSTCGLSFILVYLSIALLTVGVRGATSWTNFLGTTFQPSELAKPILIVFLACGYEKFYKMFKVKDSKLRVKYVVIFLILTIIVPILVFWQKDFGTCIIICSIVGSMYLLSPITRIDKLKSIIVAGCCVLIMGAFITLGQGHLFTKEQISRVKYWLNPCQNYENDGYQVCNGFIAFNQGGLSGLGLGKSQQKYSYIPDPHTDSVFAIIAEEFGALKSMSIFILYAILLYRICKISSNASTTRGKYICLGVSVYIFIHIFINLGGLFGIIPLTGVPLPFFTYGGSFTISLLASIAIVQRVNIETKNKKVVI